MCAKRWPSESVNTLYLKTNKQVAVEQSRKKVALHWNFSYRLWSCTWGSWQEKANSYIVYLDMSKAFNSISHNILLQKLKAIWLAPSAVSWFNSYWINAALSDVLPVVCGACHKVAYWHGTPLFSIYVNNVPAVIETCSTVRVSCYLDDTKKILSFMRVVQYSDKFMHGIMYWIVFTVLYKSVTKKKRQNKTMRNLMMPCINLLEYWTSMSFTVD